MYPSIFSWRCPLRFCVWRVRGTAPLLTKKRATATARSGADSKSQNCSNVLWSRSQRREEVEEDMCWKRLPKHQKTNQIPPDRSMYVTLERSLLFCSFKFSTFFLFFSHFWQFSSWVSDVFDFRTSRTSFFFLFWRYDLVQRVQAFLNQKSNVPGIAFNTSPVQWTNSSLAVWYSFETACFSILTLFFLSQPVGLKLIHFLFQGIKSYQLPLLHCFWCRGVLEKDLQTIHVCFTVK